MLIDLKITMSFAHFSITANGRTTLNLERRVDHEGHPLAITTTDAVTGGGIPPSFWREAPGNGKLA